MQPGLDLSLRFFNLLALLEERCNSIISANKGQCCCPSKRVPSFVRLAAPVQVAHFMQDSSGVGTTFRKRFTQSARWYCISCQPESKLSVLALPKHA